jgi:ribosome modulation factor
MILTDGMEKETEEINGMGSDDTTHVCKFYTVLEQYKSWVGGWIGN